MIQFNDLKLNPDGRCLIVDASIINQEYFDNRYITDVYVDSDLTFVSANSPSDTSVHITVDDEPKKFYKQFSITELESLIKPEEQDLRKHIFFVYVAIAGPIEGTVPCGADKDLYLGVAVNWDSIYHESLQYMKELNNCCDIPKEYIDYILRIKGLELAIKTGHFDVALHMWSKYFNRKFVNYTQCCGCNK